MSLKVWLPLIKDTDNKGLSEVTITKSNVTYSTGPLGASALFNNSWILLKDTPIKTGVEEFSFAFWYKTTSPKVNQALYNGRVSVGSAVSIFDLEGKFRFDDDSQHLFNYVIPNNEWHHYVFTRNKTNIKLYVDGVLNQTVNSSSTLTCNVTYASIGMSSTNNTAPGSNAIVGGLIDYRIYDHVLSVKEVKELAKGLSIHLPLRGTGANPNLVPNSQIWGNNVSAGNTTRTLVDYDGYNIQRFTAKQNITNGGVYTNSFSGNRWNGGTYTWSIEIRANREFTIPSVGHERFGTMRCDIGPEWRKFSKTGTYGQTSYSAFIMYFNANFPMNADDWFEVRNYKVEEGNKATPWCPCEFDTDYTRLGYGSLIYPYTLVGGPTNTRGYISGFSNTKYINTNTKINWNTANTWDMYCKFTTGTDITTLQIINSVVTGDTLNFGIMDSKFTLSLGTNAGGWNILTNDTKTFDVEASKTYYVKVSFTGEKYTISRSVTSFDTVEEVYSLESTTKIDNDIGNRVLGSNRGNGLPFLGSIDMEQTAIYLNGNPVFLGAVNTTPAILAEDTSGFDRTTTLAGRLTPITDSPKEGGASFINGTRITATTGFPNYTNAPFTVNTWIRTTPGRTYQDWSDIYGLNATNSTGGNTLQRFEIYNKGGSANWFGSFATSSGLVGYHTPVGTWSMCTWAFDGTTFYHYRNGVQYGTRTPSETTQKTWTPKGDFYVGDTGNIFFDMVDCRVYGTCLSAEDIAELYKTPIAIDKTGKLYCNNLVEE